MMIDTAGIALTSDYCTERIAALSDEKNPTTQSFVKKYGRAHTEQIIEWFKQALKES